MRWWHAHTIRLLLGKRSKANTMLRGQKNAVVLSRAWAFQNILSPDCESENLERHGLDKKRTGDWKG